MSQLKNKKCYLPPKVKTVAFSVEKGYNVSDTIISLNLTQEYRDAFEGNHNDIWGGGSNDCYFGTSEYSRRELEWNN